MSDAVHEWLARHREDAIAESYRRAYAEPDADHEPLVAQLGSYSATVMIDDESQG
ncbi:MAG: hypothetical protein M3387_00245 [Actinomycetota bacterium]|nr:hypothetical protein [Actinomycetota bacterium]